MHIIQAKTQDGEKEEVEEVTAEIEMKNEAPFGGKTTVN